MTHRCHSCRRPLRDPASIEAGVGPSCATAPMSAPTMFRAAYFAEVFDNVLVIWDREAGSTSVTNDIEHVLRAEFEARGTLPLFAIYRDSGGTYTRVRHRRGVFGGFASLGAARTLWDALATLRSQAAA